MHVLAAFAIHAAWLSVWVAPAIPLLTEWWTKQAAPGWLKVAFAAALATAIAPITTAIEQNADLILRWSMLAKIGMVFGEAMVVYLLARRPILNAVGEATKYTGIGGPKSTPKVG